MSIRRSPLALLGGLLVLYLVAPLVVLLVRLPAAGSFTAPGLWSALWVSMLTATISAAIIALLGIPLAWALAKGGSRAWDLVGVAVQLPLALPPLMSGILLIEVVGPYTLLGRLTSGTLTDTTAGIVIAQTFVSAPFLIVAARSAFSTIDPALFEVAATLGHSRWSRFRRVGLPLAGAGIRAGLLLAWLRAFGEFGATVILAYHPYSLPVFTWVQFSSSGLPTALPPTAAALAAAAVVLALARWRPAALGLEAAHCERPRRRDGNDPGCGPIDRLPSAGVRAGHPGRDLPASPGPARPRAPPGDPRSLRSREIPHAALPGRTARPERAGRAGRGGHREPGGRGTARRMGPPGARPPPPPRRVEAGHVWDPVRPGAGGRLA